MRRLGWIDRAAALFLALFGVAPLVGAVAVLDDEDQEEQEAEEEEEGDRWFALVGGDVHDGYGGILRGVTVLSKNGKIVSIDHDPFLPEGTETLDVSGYRVYPGLVALNASSRITRGLFGADQLTERELDPHMGLDDIRPGVSLSGTPSHLGNPDDWEEDSIGVLTAAELRAEIEDSFDPFSQFITLALAAGITSVEQSGAAVKLKRREIDGVLMKEKNLTTFSWSLRNPAAIRSTKEKFEGAARYLREFRAWEEAGDDDAPEPSKKGVDTGALSVLKGESLARFNLDEREDLLGVARLAQRHGFRPVIFGCREGWTIADELGRAGAYAVVTPRDQRAKNEQLVRPGGSSIENAAVLHRSGVQVAVVPSNTGFELGGIAGRDLLHLPIEAAFAVRGGMSDEEAIQTITLIPARILGVDHRVGTLEVGKDMDAIVTDGDLLHYQTFVQFAVVDGKLAYDKQEEIFYAHIRPRPERPLDPGEEPGAGSEEAGGGGSEASDASDDEGDEEDDGAEEEDEADDEEPEEQG